MTILSTPDEAVNAAAPPPEGAVLQSLVVSGRTLRRLIRATRMKVDPLGWAAIVGVGPHFPKVSGLDWQAACDPLPAGMDDLRQLPDISDIVAVLANSSFLLLVDGDAASVGELHDL